MPSIDLQQRPRSGKTSIDPPSQSFEYVAIGENDGDVVRSYSLGATPVLVGTPMGTLFRQNIEVEREGYNVHGVRVTYGPNQRASGSMSVDFDTMGGTVHIKTSKGTVGAFPVPTPPLAGPPDHKGAIGVHGDEVDGAEIVIPALKLVVHFKHPAGFITLSQIRYLARKTGTVNNSSFLGFDAGEVLFLGCSGSEGTNTETSVSYHFACSENATGFSVGDIEGIRKDGHDLAWIQFKAAVSGGQAATVPQYVYIERVYNRVNLAAVVGFGA